MTTYLYTAAQVRELDRLAIAKQGIPGIQLMKRAGRAVLETLLECWPQPPQLTVYCGSGNNGGDGYMVAALAQQQRIPVTVVQLCDGQSLEGDARRAFEFACQQSVSMKPFSADSPPTEGIVVDALLGTGYKGKLRVPYDQAIRQINSCALPVVAVDVPSGLDSDTGQAANDCVVADLTVSFIGLKCGLYTAQGPSHSGEVFFDDLGVTGTIYREVPAAARQLELESLLAALPPRPRHAHKGDFGHVVVIGGESGLGGAVMMAAESAARCGAGLVSVATRREHIAPLLARRPEIMAHAVDNPHQLLPLLQRATVLVIGPGLGRSPWSEMVLYHASQSASQRHLPLVMDADALNLLAEGVVVRQLPSALLLTPHPGEAARLLGTDVANIQADRFAAVSQLQKRYKATVILKGVGSLVASDGPDADPQPGLCAQGNPGMASGGMGDVLSGVTGALLAQGLTLQQAAELAVCLHGTAADILAAAEGERGLLATDLVAVMRRLLNPVDD